MEDRWNVKLYMLKNVEEMRAMIFYRGHCCIFKVSEKCAESARMDRKWIRKISGIFEEVIQASLFFQIESRFKLYFSFMKIKIY